MSKAFRAILVIALFGTLFGIFSLVKKQLTEPPTSTLNEDHAASIPPLVYSCIGGKTIKATFKESSVTLLLSDGRIMDLPQTLSASGIRYEDAGLVFVSKGSAAFVEENGVSTYIDCIAGVKESMGDKTLFVDTGKTFQFLYTKPLTLSSGPLGYSTEWAVNTSALGLVLAKLSLPKEVQPKTNFSEATLTVGTSSDEKAIATCIKPTNGEALDTTVMINKIPFTVLTLDDAGAGNFYKTKTYRTVRDNQCYAITYTIHSTNSGAYSPDQGIGLFDEEKIKGILENVVNSFSFL